MEKEKIVQIIEIKGYLYTLTNIGRIFWLDNTCGGWIESTLPNKLIR